ncbi:pyridoxal kinase [Clostridium beijerinckii]|uniref:pyridoxal kinase n=1 Tax=Clostridium beijerinckii TaxID=1520 RepID=A0AB74VKA0_CLOBE|nr:pyridoxamine kinase [Clostridium beijerinckii]NRZ26303.1 pyridoxine kinase [Clostridium beijerinckii]NYB98816.1 pyridoxine kinase [Clostridium beijerinckii]OOM25413.1 pyridoxine kinase [Clostridium beijerinckii]QUN37008.1 pyridoxamine kinase [Clostridium beijerinckii]SQB18899.1 phosphomethylpyrimidine kinase type-1 [Clostridium beijerinckii]
MIKPIKRAAVLHDLCGIGKAALTNVIPILSTLGVEVCPIPTMILTSHTGGFSPNIERLDGYISKAVQHYIELNINFESIFVGYLGSTNNIEETLLLLESVNKNKSLVVLDPIFADNGSYYSNFSKEYSDSLKRIIRYSHIITPNFTEACILCDEKIVEEVNEEKLLALSRKLYSFGCDNVIITSAPVANKKKIGIAVYNGENDSFKLIIRDRIERSYPGTGDVFASVLIGLIMDGNSLEKSVEESCKFVEDCIKESSSYDYPVREGLLLEPILYKLNNLKRSIEE